MASNEEIAAACAQVLVKEGYSLKQIQEKAPRGFWEQIIQVSGDSRNTKALSNHWKRNKKALSALIEAELGGGAKTPLKSDTMDIIDTDHIVQVDTTLEDRILDKAASQIATIKQELITEWEERLNMIEEQLKTISDNVVHLDEMQAARKHVHLDNVVTIDMELDPPLPPKEGDKGKKLKGTKEDIRARIDKSLHDLFMKDCERYSGNASRALDAILWRYYNKPTMSFEDLHEEEEN